MESCFCNRLGTFALCCDKVAVAVSGGVDSVTLIHLMINLMRRNISIALTVDHGLRPESKDEALCVSSYVKQLGAAESFVLNWKKENITGNIQSQARKARYKLLTEWCKSNSIKYLFVAHNKNDQAETFLLRLERGSGIDGLSSMDYKSYFNDICILRPLLDFNRSDIEQYAKFYKLQWIEDKSNQDLKYRRTLYRNLLKVTDNKEMLIQRICLTTLHMKRIIKALMYYTYLAFDNYVNIHELGYIEIKLDAFYQLPEEIAMRVFLYSIMVIGNKYYKPRYSNFISIFNNTKIQDINCTLSSCKIRKYKENILVIKEPSSIKEISMKLPCSEAVLWDNRFKCTILWNQPCSVIIKPLKKTDAIPLFLKNFQCCNDVFYSLPVIIRDEEIVAYPYTHITSRNRCNNDSKIICVISSIIKENLIRLIKKNCYEKVF
ncbi:tRNA lysidine(34) synthetase TilS [Wolbachia pipientis]|uniref:tRNA(Ile)-lysidine synthase n=2 Tax=Wolbachia pipientis TaxID=955 RepID=A0A1E7QL24_WOLPI|nr:tRNA lysidine(34) synthetase TilS [Wolbachia pipientis]OEY87180.1 tRNA lysidine(34) synthetase TilS [Wolbachia pipientis]